MVTPLPPINQGGEGGVQTMITHVKIIPKYNFLLHIRLKKLPKKVWIIANSDGIVTWFNKKIFHPVINHLWIKTCFLLWLALVRLSVMTIPESFNFVLFSFSVSNVIPGKLDNDRPSLFALFKFSYPMTWSISTSVSFSCKRSLTVPSQQHWYLHSHFPLHHAPKCSFYESIAHVCQWLSKSSIFIHIYCLFF